MRRPRRMPRGSQEIEVCGTINGVDHDVLIAIVSFCPPEPDVGFAGEIDIEGVYLDDEGDISGDCTPEEWASLECTIIEQVNAWGEDYEN